MDKDIIGIHAGIVWRALNDSGKLLMRRFQHTETHGLVHLRIAIYS